MKITTFAFAHAGGAGHNFRPIQAQLRGLELQAHDYPGHGRRVREPLLRDLDAIARDALDKWRSQLRPPYVLFGHSMGARVALLVARLAESEGLAPPLAVVASGTPAPGHGDRDDFGHLPDEGFLAKLEELGGLPSSVIDDPLMMELFLPILRADIEAIERWKAEEWRIHAPIIALHGRDDSHEREACAAWRERTHSAFLLEELPGGHFFLYEDPAAAAAAIDRAVSRIVQAR